MSRKTKKVPEISVKLVKTTKRPYFDLSNEDYDVFKPTPISEEEQQAKKKVKEDLSEKAQEKPTFYPIFGDAPHTWQADLMFMPYVKKADREKKNPNYKLHGFLVVINVNTKYAFARQLIFKSKKDEDDSYEYGKTKATKIKGTVKTADNTATALRGILDTDIPRELTWLRKSKVEGGGGVPEAKIEIRKLFTDDGDEFGGDFKKLCDDRGIALYRLSPNTGSKHRTGIVERFNKTLRRYYFKWVNENPGKSDYFNTALPKVLEEYNRKSDHRSIREFFRSKGKLSEKRFGKDVFSFTPVMMLKENREKEWYEYKKKQMSKVDDKYKDVIATLKTKPTVRYFKKPFEKSRFKKAGLGTLSQPAKVKGPTKDHNITSEWSRLRSGRLTVPSKSFRVEGSSLQVLPYDVLIA